MQVINSYASILHHFPKGNFDLSIWRSYANEISPFLAEICEKDSAHYDFEKEVLPVVNDALNHRDKMQRTNHAFELVTSVLQESLWKLFEDDIQFDIILYLGLCNGAGWATTLQGKNTILLGMEKIIELQWYDVELMRALVFHEIGHVWHKSYGQVNQATSLWEKSMGQLHREGIAMVCEQILCDDNQYFHQNKKGWLEWCRQHERELKREYLRRINHQENTQDFFGDWCDYRGYSDVGYYLGCIFVRYLLKKYTLVEIANLSFHTLLQEFEIFALSP